ncbi:MAG: DNA lyase [Ignavibacteriae bacterium]|nr:DNA lyase [Ignavibacteriota bacterium]
MDTGFTFPEELREAYQKQHIEIKQKLEDFTNVKPEEYFYELCFTLCTPQSKAKNAIRVIGILKEMNFKNEMFNPAEILRLPEHYIRFHNQKGISLMQARQNYATIEQEILSSSSAYQKREWLVRNVRGIGMKEAAHFLRNIGIFGTAILDRHILKHLASCGVIDAPVSLSPSLYIEIEKKWQKFSDWVGIPLDEMDLLFWSQETGEILK